MMKNSKKKGILIAVAVAVIVVIAVAAVCLNRKTPQFLWFKYSLVKFRCAGYNVCYT